MYKVFAFLFFAFITIAVTFANNNITGTPLNLMFTLGIILYVSFLIYIIISNIHLLKKINPHLVKKLVDKSEKLNLPKNTKLSFYFICLLLFSFLALYSLKFYFTPPPDNNNEITALNEKLDQLDSKLNQLSITQNNLESSLFYLNSKTRYELEDSEYNYLFKAREVNKQEDNYSVKYELGYTRKSYPKYFLYAEAYDAGSDTLYIKGNIRSVKVDRYNLKLMKGISLFVLKVEDTETTHYRVFYIEDTSDFSAMYTNVNILDEINEESGNIISIAPDFENTALNVSYRDKYEQLKKLRVEFYTKNGHGHNIIVDSN